MQTSETVKLELLGGEDISYRTLDFLAMSPMNLSDGFRLWITFGIDYTHQQEATTIIPETIESAVIDALKEKEYAESINSIHVHFKEASSNSLDIEVLADFNGIAGPDYDILHRTIQQICVDTCNRHNWIIPFQQVKIHMSEPQ